MRDIRTGIIIIVPAAVALASIIWFLRRKTSKKGRGGKDSGASPPLARDGGKAEVQVPAHPLHRENQGITLTQRKIPEASTGELRDSGKPGAEVGKSASGSSRISSSSASGDDDKTVLVEPQMESSSSNYEDALTSSEKLRVQEIVHNAIDRGIAVAKQRYQGSDIVGNEEGRVDSVDGTSNKFKAETVQESMTASTVSSTFHSSSSLSHRGREDNCNNNRSHIPPQHVSVKPKRSSLGEGVEDSSSERMSSCKRDGHVVIEDTMSSSSASILNLSPKPHHSRQESSSSSPHDDCPLTRPVSHQTLASVEQSLTSVKHSPSLESSSGDSSRSLTAKSCVAPADAGDHLAPGDRCRLDSGEQILEKSSSADVNTHSLSSSAETGSHSQPSSQEPPANSTSPVCDSNSVGSNDSGRGGSEQGFTSQLSDNLIHFDFNMPSDLCGRLIGRQGKNINYIKTKSGASVSLTNNPFTPEFQICQVVGSQTEVDEALAMIRVKFPLNAHPGLTMAPLNIPIPAQQVEPQPVVIPEGVQLSLPEGVSVDVYVSAIVNAGHVFVQQPTHRTFMSLEKLNYFLNSLYSQDPSIPCVPEPLECGVICVCENEGSWYRAMIASPVDEQSQCQVKFVDYGGYAQLPVSSLKQIRTDFMNLPFQAVECFMANLSPASGQDFYSDLATLSLSEKTQLKLLKCQVVARGEDGTPFVHLYDVDPNANAAVMLNRTLVEEGLVQWVELL